MKWYSPYICGMMFLEEMSPQEKQVQTVKLANRVIRGSRSLSLINEIFLYFIMGEINPNAENPLKIRTSKQRYAEYRGIAQKDFKRISGELKKIFKNFNDNPLIIENEKSGKLLQRNWLTSLDLDGEYLNISVSREVGGFLLYKKGQLYTRVLHDISKFKSVYTVGIKEIIEMELFRNQDHFDITLDFLRFKLGIQKKYSNLKDLKYYVLDAAKRELKTLNFPIQFDYAILKANKKILKKGQRGGYFVRFYIKDKRDEIKVLFDRPKDNVLIDDEYPIALYKQVGVEKREHKEQYEKEYRQLSLWGINEEFIYNLIVNYGIERVQLSIDFVLNAPNVKSPSGLFLKSMENNWKTAKQIEREGKRKQKKQLQQIEDKKEVIKKAEDERRNAFYEAQKKVCDDLLKSKKDKDLVYYYEKAKKYIAPIMMHLYTNYTPKEIYENSMFASYFRYSIEKTFPEAFEELYKQYPEFKREFEEMH